MNVHRHTVGRLLRLQMQSVYLHLHWKLGTSVCTHATMAPDYYMFPSPDLTWRDVQYICIETARLINPDDPDWEPTAVGRPYSYKYGFGVLDAARYITAAQTWTLVKPQAWFETKTIQLEGGTMNKDQHYSGGQFIGPDGVTSTLSVTKQMLVDNNLETLEHINVKVWINHTIRGAVEVEIVSPKGIKSILAKQRQQDNANTGFPGWTFMSVKHW
jgi:kexin